MRRETHLCVTNFFLIFLLSTVHRRASSQMVADDAAAMLALKHSLSPPESLGWSSDVDPCKWTHVGCSGSGRVTHIQIGRQSLRGTLPPSLRNLTELERLELEYNQISGPLPTLRGLSNLQVLLLNGNLFTSIPADFFSGMKSLASFEIDGNPFHAWQIPESLKEAVALQDFSANSVNITGEIPEFFSAAVFPSLTLLHLAMNNLRGGLPETLAGSQIQSLWVNGLSTSGKLTGTIDVISKMTSLKQVWLHSNALSGPLPDLSALKDLQVLSLRDNLFTGPVPQSLLKLESLSVLNLTNNLLQGPTPKFKNSVSVDLSPNTNSFCSPSPGDCDSRVNALLSIAKSMGYPQKFAQNWKGNDPCAGSDWMGIICNRGNITVVNFQKMGLNGTISPDFAKLKSVQRLVLADNNLTGTIPVELTTLTALTVVDVSNNRIRGKIPPFNSNVMVVTRGNPKIRDERSLKISPLSSPPKATPKPYSLNPKSDNTGRSKMKMKPWIWFVIIGCSIGIFLLLIGLLFGGVFHYMKKQKQFTRVQSPNAMVVQPRRSSSDNDSLKITVAGSSVTVGGISETPGNETQMVELEAGNMVISIHVLKNVTNNFDKENILGQGGFGTVYKGELHDGTKIAVKRMECGGVITGKGLTEFKSEIAVLTKVRHRHLVALLGYCLDGNEKLLVYEYMPEGTLSRHLFNWVEEGLQPLEWTKRLSIALDVARGVEYLHVLAHQSFIHRDLKPSNILLGDDMRAKVADFGLVRLAPDGKGSIETRLAGTFGYLAPEYAVTGRVTTKADVFSFGVILMELITGRRALDESQPEESMYLATWFKKMQLSKDTFEKSIDPSIQLDDVTLGSISTVAELAGHCCAREPYQRPDMGHAVNVLSSLVEEWKPTEARADDIYGIDLEMSLPQALKKWQAYEGSSYEDSFSSSSFLVPSSDNSQTSLPTRPHGFAESFTSQDGR